MQELIRRLLAELGEDPTREGLRDTPKRVEKAYRFLTNGYHADIDEVLNNARRLQVQERLTNQIAGTIRDKIAPLGVAVVMEATHLCMSMRGVEKQNSFAVTSAMLGAFRDNSRTRMEFLELIKLRSAVPGLSDRISAGLACVGED